MPSDMNNTLAPSCAHNVLSVALGVPQDDKRVDDRFIDTHDATRNIGREKLSRTKREHVPQRRRDDLMIAERQNLCADDLASFMALAGNQQHVAETQIRNRLADRSRLQSPIRQPPAHAILGNGTPRLFLLRLGWYAV